MRLYFGLTISFLLLASRAKGQASEDVTVDDSYSYSSRVRSGIQYFPSEASWSTGAASGVSQRFNNTLHISNASYTRAMFFFQGSEIHYYGDKGPGYGTVMVNIDGERGAFEPVDASSPTVQYQQLLWSRTGLSPGDHQILITKNDSVAGLVSMDYFRIVPSNSTILPVSSGPGASVVPDEALIVDNTDPSVSYSGAWEPIQNPGGAITLPDASFYQNTVHRTTTPGSIATFRFDGTAVWYFSDIDATHGYVDISVDGGSPDLISGYNDHILCQRHIWSKTGLAAGGHNVTITHRGTPVQYATVDFFRYLPSNATATVPSGTNNDGSGNDQPRRRTNVGVIVGGAIGGLIIIGAILYAVFVRYRRRTQWASHVPNKSRWDIHPAPEMADRIEPYEAMPFITAHEGPATTTFVQPQSGYSKSSHHSTPAGSYPTISGSVSELSSYTSSGSSRTFTHYGQYDLPPSYQ